MAAVTIHSDFGAEENKIYHCFHFFLYLPRSDEIRCHDLSFLMSWWRGLCNWMKLWAMPCRATQNGWVIVETSDKMWSTRREWQIAPVFLPRESHERYEKTKWGDVVDFFFFPFRICALRVTSVLDIVDNHESWCLMFITLDPLCGNPVDYASKLPLHLGLRGHVQGFQEMESV